MTTTKIQTTKKGLVAADDPIVGYVKKTYDYEKFAFINVNRDKDLRNLKNLRQSMTKQAYDKPILVTDHKDKKGKLWIIDGQHTFTIRKELNLPIYYMYLTFKDRIELEDEVIVNALCAFNAVGKNWTTMNFVKYYAERDFAGVFKDYTLLMKFIKEYPKIKNIQAYLMLGQGHFRKESSPRGGQFGYIREGKYKFSDWDLACKRADNLMLYINKLGVDGHMKDVNFKLALVRLIMMEHLGVNHDKFSDKVKAKIDSVRRFRNMEDYLLALTDIYNLAKRYSFEDERINFAREYKRYKRAKARDSLELEGKKPSSKIKDRVDT